MNRHLSACVILSALAACSEAPAPQGQAKLELELKPAVQLAALPSAVQGSAAMQAAAGVQPRSAPKADPNAALAQRVKQALEGEAKVHAAAIDVTAAGGGVVTLWGTADSDDERLRAARAAYRVDGVNTVRNRLAVVSGS